MMEYRLDEIFDLQMGKTPSRNNPEYWDSEDNKWISIADLSKCGKYIEETKEYLSDKAVNESGISLIPANTVIMSFKLSIGKTAITPEPMYSNEAIMSFRDKHVVELLPDYIYYMFSGKNWEEGTNKAVMGKTLNKATLSSVKVSIHDIVKQHEIVEVLDKLSSVIDNRQQELEKLDELIKARFVEMFGNPAHNEKRWGIKALETVTTIVTYGLTVRPEYIDEGIDLVSAKELRRGYVAYDEAPKISEGDFEKLSDKGKPQKNDILFSKTGSIGHCAIVENKKPFAITQNAARIGLDIAKVNPLWVLYYLRMDYIQDWCKNHAKGNAVKDLQLQDMKIIPLFDCPLDLQNCFAEFVKQVDKSKTVVQKALDEAQLLFQSLMQDYFG